MQRIGLLVVGLLLLAAPRAPGQQATGTTLWRVAATTLTTPPALALGPAAAMWNPAQTEDSARLQLAREERWTIGVGAGRLLFGDKLRVAAATHFFSSLKTNDPAQDVYAGLEGRIWQGPVSRNRVVVRGRYGISFAHGFGADHQLGVGAEVAKTVALDLMVSREGGYSDGTHWRPAAGLRLVIGKYRVTLARDAGVNDLGSTYRGGVDMRVR